MSPDQNKQLVGEFIERVMNARRFEEASRFFAPDATDHLQGSLAWNLLLLAIPDYRVTVEHMIADGEHVTVLAGFRGVHAQAFMAIPPTGKGVNGRVAFSFRIVDGRIVESWSEFEPWGLLQQLGIDPLANAPRPSFARANDAPAPNKLAV